MSDTWLTYLVDPAEDRESQAIAVALDVLQRLDSATARLRVLAYLTDRVNEAAYAVDLSTLGEPR